MPWIKITKEHVVQRATTIETDVVDSVGSGGVSPLEGTIASTTEEVRSAVKQYDANRLDAAADTIPASLLNCALSLIVFRLASRALTQEILVQDARYQQYARALETLDKVRTGEVKVEDPITGEMHGDGSGVEVAESAPFRFSRRNFSTM